MAAGEHQVSGEGLRKIIINNVRPGSSIEGVPGSHFNFTFQIFGLRHPSHGIGVTIRPIVTRSAMSWLHF